MRLFLIGLVALFLLPAHASATEGAIASGASWVSADGRYSVQAYYLCDGDHTAAAACAELDLANIIRTDRGLGAPDTIQFLIYRQSTNCTPTVTVQGRAVPTATAGATQVDHTVQALLGTGTSSYTPAQPTLFRVYRATVSNDADCTDLEVLALLHYTNSAR
jgi:hypothetical protein